MQNLQLGPESAFDPDSPMVIKGTKKGLNSLKYAIEEALDGNQPENVDATLVMSMDMEDALDVKAPIKVMYDED